MAGAMSEAVGLEFEAPTGERLRFEWNADDLAALDPQSPPQQPPWRLAGELDWDQVESVRAISARIGDGRLLVIAALRPSGVGGHGDELVAAAIGDANEFAQLDEALVSTEYGSDRLPRRLGLELYPGEGLPLRLAADVVGISRSDEGGLQRTSAQLAIRGGGDADGAGICDVLERR